jgi:heme exporter protein A
VLWDDRPIGKARDDFHTNLGYLGHPNSLKADLTARENLRYLAGLRQSIDVISIDRALDRVGILSRGDLPSRSLSAGQKRRLALARLLLADATVWIMDEPATNLDSAGVELVEDLIREHVERGGLVLAAAHQRLLDDANILRRLELD